MPRRVKQWAFTPAEPVYPPFVNVAQLDDGNFEITVRAPASDDGRCGGDATMPISRFDLRQLVAEIAGAIL